MPDIEWNQQQWGSRTNWSQHGEGWSSSWGSADMQWYCVLLPRIHRFVPARTILEIAPGFGRWTLYLKDLCTNLIVVDLVEQCISACKERFVNSSHINYFVNDGKSLEMVDDN